MATTAKKTNKKTSKYDFRITTILGPNSISHELDKHDNIELYKDLWIESGFSLIVSSRVGGKKHYVLHGRGTHYGKRNNQFVILTEI